MSHTTAAARSSRSRRLRTTLPVLMVAGLVGLSACATPVGGVSPSATATAASASPSASPTSTPTGTPSPSPSASATPGTVYNGEILIVTSEVRDGNLEVSAMVPGISESGGTCTLTVDSTGATASVEANEGKDVTYCGLMSIAVGGDAPEDLAFHVSYASRALQAQSSITTIEPTP
ncbi:hypothetical protein AB0O16_10730 [Microbacterium sp. NPDC089180]|uniref:hypothetical protein n=1 Tax=unclassified Microbacterium TaxID=2609290 RepID=UPI00342230C0